MRRQWWSRSDCVVPQGVVCWPSAAGAALLQFQSAICVSWRDGKWVGRLLRVRSCIHRWVWLNSEYLRMYYYPRGPVTKRIDFESSISSTFFSFGKYILLLLDFDRMLAYTIIALVGPQNNPQGMFPHILPRIKRRRSNFWKIILWFFFFF